MKKKTLSLLLVLAMVLGSFSFAFAAEEPAAMTEAEAGEFLKKAGVLEGNDAGDLMLDKALKRQDMVVLFSRLLGQEEEAKTFDGQPTFKDIRDKYYNPYLAWGQANKLIEGHTEERFGYNEEMTAQQYVTILLRALGYGEEAKEYDNVVAKAKELGLLKDVKVENETKITRGQMSVMTMNALGTKMKDSDKTLADKLEIEMPVPEKLEVKEVKADNLKEIKVVFNKDVDESVLNLDNYETDAGDIEDLFVENENILVLRLEESMDNKEEYSLTIEGTEEIDGKYEFKAFDNAIPEVVEVKALGTKAVKVTMSEPVKKANTKNFKIDGKPVYGKIDTVGREVVLNLYKTLEAGKEYELTVAGLEDFNKYKSLENKYSFEVVEDKEKPTVVDHKAYLERVMLVFSEDIDNVSVKRTNIYWKNGTTKVYPETVVKIAGNKVLAEFTADKALPVYETTLYVEGFKDYSDNKMDADEIKVKPSIDETRPEVQKVELQKDLKTIVVKFSKSVNKNDATDIGNYRVLDKKDNKQVISEVKQVSSRVYEVVLGKKLSEKETYTFKVSGIKDTNKYPNVMVEHEQKIAVGDHTAPEFAYVSGEYDYKTYKDDKEILSIIHVFFDKEMDLATLSNPDNYLVEINGANKLLSDVGGEVDIIKDDGTVVVLRVINEHEVNKVGVLGVKDTAGKKLSNYGQMKLVNTDVKPSVKKAVAKAKDKVVVEFSMPIKEVKDGAFKIVDKSTTRDNKVAIKDVEVDGDIVTLKVDELTADAQNYKLEIAEDKVIAYNDKAVKVPAKELTDKIAPSIEKATAKFNNGELVIEVEFDENVNVKSGAETDFTVKMVEGDKDIEVKSVSSVSGNPNLVKLELNHDKVDVDTEFIVGIKNDVRFITDASNEKNPAKEMTKRTNKLEVVKTITKSHNFEDKTVGTVVVESNEKDITLENATILENLVIDAPNAHVVNKATVTVKGDVIIEDVSADSFVNEGTINGNIVIATNKEIKITTGDNFTGNIINGTGEKITIKVNKKEVTLGKDEKVNKDGKTEEQVKAEEELVEAKSELDTLIKSVEFTTGEEEAITSVKISETDKVVTYTVSTDGKDVDKTAEWVTAETANTLKGAVDKATEAKDAKDATIESVNKAKKDLNAAIKTFKTAAKNGTKVETTEP